MVTVLEKIEQPSHDDMAEAKKALEVLGNNPEHIHSIVNEATNEKTAISSNVYRILTVILKELAEGKPVLVAPYEAELTTNEAASLLNISRPYLLKLLKEDQLNYHYIGSHKRLLVKDVLEYKSKIRKNRRSALRQVTAVDDELEHDLLKD